MPRLSTEELRGFASTPEFETFCVHLKSERCLTQTDAVQHWPVSRYTDLRERNQHVSAALREIATRSRLDKDDPNFVSIKDHKSPHFHKYTHDFYKYTHARVVALLPDGIVGDQPIQVFDRHPTQLESVDLAVRLAERIPQFAVIRKLTVFRDWSSEYGSFANGALDYYQQPLQRRNSLKISREHVTHLLRNIAFLKSWNMTLFMSAIRERVTGWHDWMTKLGNVTENAVFSETDRNEVNIAFLGALTASQIVEVFSNPAPSSACVDEFYVEPDHEPFLPTQIW